MKIFQFRGGVHPEARKRLSSDRDIESLPIPRRLFIPVQQHIGAPAKPEVNVGQRVLKGELLAHSQGAISAPIHAPSSGEIVAVTRFTAPHPSGLPVKTIVLETDGLDEWTNTTIPGDPFDLSSDEIAARVGSAGIVGLGGATFPSAVKLNLGAQYQLDTLVINGGECEPYLTCDDRLMRESSDDIIDGISIMMHALGVKRTFIAIENNKPQAIESMRMACKTFKDIHVVPVPSLYPMGSEKQMVQALTGKEIPAGKLSADIGIIVHNVGTAAAVHHALRSGRPLVSRIVTVSGKAVREPRNLKVLFGTPISALFEYCGGLTGKPARILMGGPMMGQIMPHEQVPVVKGSSGVIALTRSEVRESHTMPCIRCGSCIEACPVGLLPLEMASRARTSDFEGAVDYGLRDCIGCGSCSFVCPSHIPLVHYFNYAKGEMAARQREQAKSEKTRILADARASRLEAQEEQKRIAAEKRKKLRAAQQTQKEREGAA